MWIVAIAWIYVVGLMALTEPSVVAGIMTFFGFCVLPLSLVFYLTGSKRRRARKAAAAPAAGQAPAPAPATATGYMSPYTGNDTPFYPFVPSHTDNSCAPDTESSGGPQPACDTGGGSDVGASSDTGGSFDSASSFDSGGGSND